MRELILDESLAPELAAELRARGRAAAGVAELGLSGASDAAVARAVLARNAVLVTTADPGGVTLARVDAPAGAGRREAVHRHAHEMALQRPGSRRRYGPR